MVGATHRSAQHIGRITKSGWWNSFDFTRTPNSAQSGASGCLTAGITFHAGAVPDQREVAAFAAGLPLIALGPCLGPLFGRLARALACQSLACSVSVLARSLSSGFGPELGAALRPTPVAATAVIPPPLLLRGSVVDQRNHRPEPPRHDHELVRSGSREALGNIFGRRRRRLPLFDATT